MGDTVGITIDDITTNGLDWNLVEKIHNTDHEYYRFGTIQDIGTEPDELMPKCC